MRHMDSYAEAMQQLQADYRKAREGLANVQQGLTGTTANVRAKSRRVSATVDASGKLVGLTFHGQSYRSLAPADLAELVVETVNKAHEAAQREMWKSAAAFLPTGVTVEQLLGRTADWSAAMPDEISLPRVVQEALDRGFGGDARPSGGAA